MERATATELCEKDFGRHEGSRTHLEQQIFTQPAGFRRLRNPLDEGVASCGRENVELFRRRWGGWNAFNVTLFFKRGQLTIDLLVRGLPEIANSRIEALGQLIPADRSTQQRRENRVR